MPLDASETFFSTQTMLWLAASAVAAVLLFGSINRRRSRLTDTLREYVEKDRGKVEPPSPSNQDDSSVN